MTFPACSPAVLLVAVLAVPAARTATTNPVADPIRFDRDVKPLLAKHCLACHGPDKQRADLRLDRKADALRGGESGKLIVPGKPAESLLVQRVTATDDTRMPPTGDGLTPAEVARLKAWIEQGADWPDDGSAAANPADWWSFRPIRKPAVPPGVHPIDALIRAKLRDLKLSPSPAADRRTLIRRLYFDLIGLPPTPAEIEAFLNDKSPTAYEQLVDRLLASPHYGERWARHWLDVVHYGETHGYDKDKPRPHAWPYRDYVIRAFNTDKPYARFVQEQIAGDVLFPGTVDGIEALGFLAAGPWDFIGHVELPESKIDGKVARHLDRDDFVSNTIGTFVGLTIHCAQCHHHKFDPITQDDYYALQAVFAAIDRTERTYDADPAVAARRAELEAALRTARNRITTLHRDALAQADPELQTVLQQLEAGRQPATDTKPPEFGYHSEIAPKPDVTKWVQVDLGASTKLERIVLRPCHDDFNNIGAGFGFPPRFRVELSDDPLFQSGVVLVATVDERTADVPRATTAPLVVRAEGKAGRYLRVTATRLAPRRDDFIFALAELEAFDAAGKNRAAGQPVTALDSIEAPVRWAKGNLTDGKFPPPPRLSVAELARLTQKREALLNQALGERGVAELARLQQAVQTAEAELARLPVTRRTAYIGAVHTGSGNFVGTGASGGKPRPIYLLQRGDVTRPGKEVAPGAIASIPGVAPFTLPAQHTEADRRAALARWITDPNHPLTWRVMANRLWQYHFGRGLVDTPNDFGKMGQLPTHPELLDYLASELRDHQSLKKLHKLIVTSATYQQVSTVTEANARRDADNRYLWRQNRRKLEAEAVRDSILFVAGKLDLRMGGPSFQDFVIEKPDHSPHYQYHLHDPDDPRSHRRTIYRFVVRSKLQPFLAALDCADPSLAVERRNETQTPQQALALLNSRLAVVMAQHFADRVARLAATDAERVTVAIRLALGRDPTPKERDLLTAYLTEHGLANTCRLILNLNEFVFVD